MSRRYASFVILSFVIVTSIFIWFSLSYRLHEANPNGANAMLHAEPLKKKLHEHALEVARAGAVHAATETSIFDNTLAVDENPVPEVAGFGQEKYAYVFYAPSDTYACSVLVNIWRLHALGASLPIHAIASTQVSNPNIQALKKIASVHIQQPPPLHGNGGGYYQDCLLKLLAFKMHELGGLTRILLLDSDQLIMKNMDHLFQDLPNVDLAAPRAYWLGKEFLASTFMMITLSDRLWESVKNALDQIGPKKFDMDLVNELLGDTVMLLSGEYVTLNSHWEDWNLPNFFHPVHKLNLTTIEVINKLSKHNWMGDKRRREGLEAESKADDVVGLASLPTSEAQSLPTSTTAPSTIPPSPISDSQKVEANTAKTTPRFPPSHPLTLELHRRHEAAAVIHFSALGKPWVHSAKTIALMRQDAHPIFAQQFEIWRRTAEEVCPGGIPPVS